MARASNDNVPQLTIHSYMTVNAEHCVTFVLHVHAKEYFTDTPVALFWFHNSHCRRSIHCGPHIEKTHEAILPINFQSLAQQ